MRMTILIAIVDVGTAVFVVVLAGAFNTIVISLALHFAKLRWRRVPAPVMILEGGQPRPTVVP